MELRAVRGMNDILPEEVERWHKLEGAFRLHAELHGYAEVRTPLLEPTELFQHQMGETTDVVEKEMYSFERHGDQLTVRPEGTAGAARAYVEHAVHAKEPVTRWYYLGPMFRGERPAKGRYRQFYQAGCELFGDPGPLCDAETIDLVGTFLQRIGVGDFVVHVNSLGSAGTRERYREALLAHFTPRKGELSEDSQRRLEKNPLRILDSKDPRDHEVSRDAPSTLDLLDDADRAHWQGVLRCLDVLGVNYVVDRSLVRGLDYYTRTLFEVKATSGDLGAQSTLAGGGRYDNMVAGLGGPSVPAIGFAMGMERLLTMMPDAPARRRPGCFLAPLGQSGADRALLLAKQLRALGVSVELDGRGGRLKAMLRRADALGARLCVILGDSEVERGVVQIKDLVAHVQEEIPLEGAARVLADRALEASPGGQRGAR
ncbi:MULTISPECIES: histidine--tRNA ligase [Sorangium]|uniref:Histidine--tRNA ligase n=1 Tax=Sorangium cellulosum TaxID=56 RepID=A0A4P2QUQ2_SORCE|nr:MULTISPECIES: histidine--tRNA ligase [Sorangium]AUX33801.1 histidyl-tRNA synthetase [Sorangium cellulosum]WCQ93110.1 Histidine--tRNA ligase [Sorangium sp. Soce836]